MLKSNSPPWLGGAPCGVDEPDMSLPLLRRALRFSDRNPVIDRDLTQHTGMVRIGNDALDRWAACPGVLRAEQLVREVGWIGLADPAIAA